MNQCALLILLFSVLGSFLACGVFGGSAPEGPERMVPDDVLELLVVDVGEAALSRTDLPPELESEVSTLENFGDVRKQATLSLPTGEVTLTGGDFHFEDIRNDLREESYTTATYRGDSFLESADGNTAAALLEKEGFYVTGDFDAVVAVLRDNSREEGLLWEDEDGELRRAMELAGEGLVVTAGRNCQLENNVGCRAVAWAFSRGEERRTVIVGSAALLFRDASAAAGASAGVERAIGTNELVRLTEILTDDATITLRVDIDREDFALLELPINLGRR